MARARPIATNFTAGELSPLFDGRIDVSKRYNGARKLENFLALSMGAALKRPGTRFVRASTVATAWGSRLIPFEFNVEQAYACEFTTDGDVFFHTNNGVLLESWEVTGMAYVGTTVTLTVTGTANLNTRWAIGHRVTMATFARAQNEQLNWKTYTVTAVTGTTVSFVEPVVVSTTDPAIAASDVRVFNADYPHRVTHPYTGTGELEQVQFAQSADFMYLTQRGHAVQSLQRTNAYTFALAAYVTTGVTFGTTDNYPGCVALFGQRLIFASTNNDPQKVWLSEAGVFNAFPPSGTGAAAAFSFELAESNRIEWVAAGDELLLGLAGGEVLVRAGADGLAPDAFLPKPQTNYGCAPIQPVRVDSSVLFVQLKGRRVRELAATEYDAQVYRAPDLLLLSNHLTGGFRVTDTKAIKQIAFQREPYPVMWCVRADRKLIAMSYERAEQAIGWTPHPIRRNVAGVYTEEHIDSVCVIPVDGGYQTWLTVTTTASGTTARAVVYIDDGFDEDTPADAYYVDSGLTFDQRFDAWTVDSNGPPLRINVGNHLKQYYSSGTTPGYARLWHSGVTDLVDGLKVAISAKLLNWTGDDWIEVTNLDGSDIDSSAWSFAGSPTVYGHTIPTSVSGLDHLEGQTVSVLANGAVIEGLVVVSGAIAMPSGLLAHKIHVGTSERAHLRTMPLAIPQSGSVGLVKSWSDIGILVDNTGTLDVNGDPITIRTPEDILGDGPMLFTGLLDTSDLSVPDENATIDIISERPVPCTILAITGNAQISDS